jgi:hypothetical protein
MRASIVLGLTLATLVGCSSSSDSTGGAAGQQGIDDFCSHNCAREHTCLSDDQATCTAKCKNDLAAIGPKLRNDYLSGISTCLDGVDCAKWGTDAGKCASTSSASLAPSQGAQDFCNAFVKKQKDCSTGTGDLATCLNSAKIYGDPALSDASACLSQACADYAKCITASLGGK